MDNRTLNYAGCRLLTTGYCVGHVGSWLVTNAEISAPTTFRESTGSA
jgi:hypothetical protein